MDSVSVFQQLSITWIESTGFRCDSYVQGADRSLSGSDPTGTWSERRVDEVPGQAWGRHSANISLKGKRETK